MMETLVKNSLAIHPGKTSLQELVSQVISSYMHQAARNKNTVINEVPGSLPISADEELLATVLSGMLEAVVSHARNSQIRMMAKAYGDIILIHLKDSNSYNGYAVASGLARVQPLAEKMGGYLDITSQRMKEMTIAFTFPNLCAA